ncbi:MAG: class I SAM-dependent methyltransferase [Candidatus Rokuibacteriota bacterium]
MDSNTIPERRRTSLPAAGHDWALPLYDPLVMLIGGDPTRSVLVDRAAIRPGDRVLEIGCGTGSLLLRIKRRHPDAEVVGLDPDPKALARASQKAARAAVAIQLDEGFADDLPYPDASFDRVFSSFMLHHLPDDEKARALREARRVLRPRGSLHLLDFAGAHARAADFLARRGHSPRRSRGDADDRVLALMSEAGFADARRVGRGALLFGLLGIGYYQAAVPGR